MKDVAIVGCGKAPAPGPGHKVGWGIASAHAEGYRTAFPDARLHAVDPNADNLTAFGERWDIPKGSRFASVEALYEAVVPEMLSVCTWPALHVPLAIDACDRGVRAVTVEKPLGIDSFQVRELLDTAKRTGTRVAVAHQRRYEAPFVRARQLIADGTLGDGLVLDARVGDDWDVLSWTVHWFDIANYLFDAEPRSVLAGVDHAGQRRYGHAVEHASVVYADYGPKRQALFVTGPVALPGGGVSVRGEKGLMVIGNPLKLWTTAGYQEFEFPEPPFARAFADLFADLWNSPAGVPSRCDISRCATATLMAFAAHESATACRSVPFPSGTWYPALEVAQHPPVRATARSQSVVVLADEHHEWPAHGAPMSGRLGLTDAIAALGHRVTSVDAVDELPPDAFSGADVLVLYHTQPVTRDSHRAQVGKWFESGRPVVVSHCGIGAYKDWPAFREWIGQYWVWGDESSSPSRHPHVSCELTVDRPDRFDVPWASAWLPTDELYQNLGQAAPVVPLVTAVAVDGARQVYAWQVERHPNVVVWLPGHRRDMFGLSVVRDGLAAAIDLAVAATRRATP